jgi:ubiquinone/menaquinone biosynthesis C-methylase UbiE
MGIANADTLIQGDVHRLPFAPASFDLVTSVAAFEHFSDPRRVIAELGRVIRPGGMVWTSIHLFTSLSGGHNLSKTEIPLRRMPRGVEPWDHLRRRALPVDPTLNGWRREQYVDAFARQFEILKRYCTLHEGEQFLTPALERELASYSRDELTCAAYVIVARKRAPDAD